MKINFPFRYLSLFGSQTSDFHLYRDRLIAEGTEKATKRKKDI